MSRVKYAMKRIIFLLMWIAVSCAHAGELDELSCLEKQAAELQKRIEATDDSINTARLMTERGICLREIHQLQTRLSKRRKGEKLTEERIHEMKVYESKAVDSFEVATGCFADVYQNYPETESAPVALWYLQTMYTHQEPLKCIELCHELLEHYPDAALPMIQGMRMHFNVYLTIASCHTKLGNRSEAIQAYVQSMLSAENDRCRTAGVKHLLDYEPRFALAERQKQLNAEGQALLE